MMDSNIFLTYIVPCYNVEKQIIRCIESLEKQYIDDDSNIEFILVNDGSQDRTLSIIEQFAGRDRRVIVINQDNQGVCLARNNALKIARGEYVFFLDGDDYLTDNASKVMFDLCVGKNTDIALFGIYQVYENKPDIPLNYFDCSTHIIPGCYDLTAYLRSAKSLPISSKLYRRDFLRDNNILFDEHLKIGEVYTFFIHSLTLANTISASPDYVMYYYKPEKGSATSVIDIERDKSIIDTLHTISAYVNKNYPQLLNKRSFIITFFWLITSFSLIKYAGRMRYLPQIGEYFSIIKQEKEYDMLVKFLTSIKGFRIDRYSLLALVIRILPIRMLYAVLRVYCVTVRMSRVK